MPRIVTTALTTSGQVPKSRAENDDEPRARDADPGRRPSAVLANLGVDAEVPRELQHVRREPHVAGLEQEYGSDRRREQAVADAAAGTPARCGRGIVVENGSITSVTRLNAMRTEQHAVPVERTSAAAP